MSFMPEEMFRKQKFLGQRLSEKSKKEGWILHKIGFVSQDWRLIIALIECYRELKPPTIEKEARLQRIERICTHIGMAEFLPDLLTHLSLRLGDEMYERDADDAVDYTTEADASTTYPTVNPATP